MVQRFIVSHAAVGVDQREPVENVPLVVLRVQAVDTSRGVIGERSEHAFGIPTEHARALAEQLLKVSDVADGLL